MTDTHVKITVEDFGVGIHKNHQSLLFQPFSQVKSEENRKMNPSGNGLGLFISRNICRSLGGDLVCKSQLGQGTKMELSVAYQAANPLVRQ